MKTPPGQKQFHQVMIHLTVKFILRTDKGNGTTFPLMMHCHVNGERCRIGMGITLRPENWNPEKQRVVYCKGSPLTKKEESELNEIIIYRQNFISEIRHHFTFIGQDLTKEIFLEELRNESKKNSVVEFIKNELPHLKEIHEIGTYRHHLVTLEALKVFMPEMVFADLSVKLIEKWGVWLRKKRGLSESTIWKYHKELKMFINLAISRRIRVENPYDHIKLQRFKGNRAWLSPEEVERLKELYHKNRLAEHLQRVLGAFLFSCFSGLRISDVKLVTHEEIAGEELIFLMRKNRKLQKIVRVPLNKTAQTFIHTNHGPLFSLPADSVVNRHLKDIWHLVDLNSELSFHSSRHTFAMLFLDSGGKVEVLQRLMGHSKIETTMEYVHLRNEAAKEQMMLMDK